VASGNYTVGEIGDLVQSGVRKYLDRDVKLNIKHIQDYRNYKVSIEKAKKVLSFHPKNDVESIIQDLVNNHEKFKDMDNPNYYNIQVFKKLSKK
jgi:nucleoside-diphosphate-sugar epimerase